MSGWLRVETASDPAGLLDGRTALTSAAFHDAAADALGFPDWYGRNWDSFEECLADLPGPLTVRHAEDLLADEPRALATLVSILRERGHAVTLAVPPGAEGRCPERWRAAGVVEEADLA